MIIGQHYEQKNIYEQLKKFEDNANLNFNSFFENRREKEYYDNGKLKYEGEYFNGEKNGKGREYYENGNLKFEGKYLNGKRWNGKGYNII